MSMIQFHQHVNTWLFCVKDKKAACFFIKFTLLFHKKIRMKIVLVSFSLPIDWAKQIFEAFFCAHLIATCERQPTKLSFRKLMKLMPGLIIARQGRNMTSLSSRLMLVYFYYS
jgi:hypothetical protein